MMIQHRPLSDLLGQRHPKNPKRHDIAKLKASIVRFGFTLPPTLDFKTQTLVAGHGRLHALAELKAAGEPRPQRIELGDDGEWLVPVITGIAFANDEERDAYVIADNKLVEVGGWDDDALRDLLVGFGSSQLDSIGFTAKEYNKLMSGFRTRSEQPKDVAPDLPATPVTRPGDIWVLGQHRLVCGDSTDPRAAAAALDDDLAVIGWTDPPYNVDIGANPTGRTKERRIENDALGADFPAFMAKIVGALHGATVPGAMLYLSMSCQEWPLVDGMLRSSGWHWSTTIIWAKDRFIISRRDYHPEYEPIWYGWKDDAPRARPNAARDVGDLWQIARPSVSKDHPTMKPVELVARALRHSSLPGDLVLDLFGGSGTTLMAAEWTGRRAGLVEISPGYCDVIVARWEDFTGEKARRNATL